MRPVVVDILAELRTRHGASGRVHLNDLAEVIGTRAVSQDEIESIVDTLEAEGLRVGEALDERDLEVTRTVLASARRLAASLARRPTVDEIAADTGLAAHEVRRGLEHALPRKGA